MLSLCDPIVIMCLLVTVEHWGSAIENFKTSEASRGRTWYSPKEEDIKAVEAKYPLGITNQILKNSEYYKKICAYGKACQKNYVKWKWVRSRTKTRVCVLCFSVLILMERDRSFS